MVQVLMLAFLSGAVLGVLGSWGGALIAGGMPFLSHGTGLVLVTESLTVSLHGTELPQERIVGQQGQPLASACAHFFFCHELKQRVALIRRGYPILDPRPPEL